ncbi:hypothetical protein [Bacterioplanoides sp.]|uniref:hypothetical protein n=1 Tax=Bacterioplanoides sp. TaxID=2066072 RepID=UPI003B598CC1
MMLSPYISIKENQPEAWIRNSGSKKLRKRRRTIMSDYIDDLLDVGYDDFDDDVDDAVEL